MAGVMGVAALLLVGLGPAQIPRLVGEAYAGSWETVFSEPFDSELGPGWTAVDASDAGEGNYTWGTTSYTFTSPAYSAWSVGGGVDGSKLEGGDTYPRYVNAWLVYGPLDLKGVREAHLEFKWWLETGGVGVAGVRQGEARTVEQVAVPPGAGDWLGWCLLDSADDFENARCDYVSGSIGRWLSGSMPVHDGSAGRDEVWIAFHFVSDGDGAGGRGAFVDDVTLRVRRDHRVFLPHVRRDPAPTPTLTPTPDPTATPTVEPWPRTVLENGGFEVDWAAAGGTHRAAVYRADGSAGEENPAGIRTPPGWLTWFRHRPGHWEEPMIRGISRTEDPLRVHHEHAALEIVGSYRPYDAGVLQQVDVEPGTTVRLSAWAHAWSNSREGPERGNPLWSEGPGFECGFQRADDGVPNDDADWRNFTFWLGIDPTGGVDPEADTVMWGEGAHIYNCFAEVPAVQVEAQSRRVTVFLRSWAQWPFEHNQAYWDQVELLVVDGDGDWANWPYPVFDRGSRIGVHSIRPNEVGRFAEDLVAGGTHFPVVKAVDDLGWLRGIKESSPETILIGRLVSRVEGCHNVEDPDTDLDEMARALMSIILNELTKDARMRGVVEYWEVANEPDPRGTEGYRRLAELMIKCMEKAERYGLKLALFSLNAGTPEWEQMEAMVETGVFARAKEGGHILALHEGTFTTHDPRDGWGGSIPGAPDVEGAGSLNFRYRYLYHLLEQRDEVVPLVVSEWYCGDEASAATGTIIDALRWYDDEASKDYYFWATCPFTLGPTPQWEHTDYERFYPGLVEYVITFRDRENAVPQARAWWRMMLRRLGWW